MDNKNMEESTMCRKCNRNEICAEPLDPIFRLNCNDCVMYRTEKARTKWINRTEAVLYSCRPCWTSYRTKQPLVPHECPREDVFTCTECGQQLYSEEDLSKHTKYLHRRRTQSEQCWMCGVNVVNWGEHVCGQNKTVGNKGSEKHSSKTHILSHTGEKSYKCNVCMKGFAYSSYLKRHMLIHTGEKPFKCGICLKGFAGSSTLKRHSRTHTGEKPYKCEICTRGFAYSSDLKSHIHTHTGEKPYKCEICMKGFAQSGSLNSHISIHRGEKPYKCEICMKRFLHSSNLKRHLDSHMGNKPYKCGICMKGFARSSHLKKHNRTH